ncbi:RS12-like protein [Mya arenaria]|uniref:40S ribosomal protein S12 n=1 Tax=Mya arenaria TaxID=6604 RepID=A0ABY7FPZ4_MYAAR|nr:RS12-like protein [Mya arenaria]
MNRLKTAWCADDRPRQTLCMSYVNYKTDKRQFRRLHRNSVNQYLVKLDQEIDRKAEEDSKGFWCLVKRRRNTKKNLVGAGLNFDGSVVRDQSVITGKWAEYFQELYTPMTDERFDNTWKETAETEVSNEGRPFLDMAGSDTEGRQAHMCVLANNCDEAMYVKLVEALCAEHGINLIKVDDNKKLGEWVGLCKIDKEGKARKIVGCSCVVVKDYGKESQALDVLNEYFRNKK